MPKHTETGSKGEYLAGMFLKKIGYQILTYNWRSGRKEVDIIASYRHRIVFVEVKTRTSIQFGYPEDAVSVIKQENLKMAAADFLERNPQYKEIQFDIVSIVIQKDKSFSIMHFPDAF